MRALCLKRSENSSRRQHFHLLITSRRSFSRAFLDSNDAALLQWENALASIASNKLLVFIMSRYATNQVKICVPPETILLFVLWKNIAFIHVLLSSPFVWFFFTHFHIRKNEQKMKTRIVINGSRIQFDASQLFPLASFVIKYKLKKVIASGVNEFVVGNGDSTKGNEQ